jgi:hypothetical protein
MASTQSVGDAADMIQQMGGMSQVKMAIDGYLNLPDNAARGVYSKSLLRAGIRFCIGSISKRLGVKPCNPCF